MQDEKTRFLEVISTPQQIRKHQLNNSKNKQFCIFPQCRRFPSVNKIDTPLCYDINRDFHKQGRSTSFGYGNKEIFQQLSQYPAPNKYEVDQHTILKRNLKKGSRFGEAREKCPVMGQKDVSKEKLFPGPGSYNLQGYFSLNKNKGPSFRLKPVPKAYLEMSNLGPGRYSQKILNEKNLFLPSTYKNAPRTVINPLQSTFSKIDKENQVNFVCDVNYQMNEKGKYFNSKYENTRNGKISKQERDFMKQFQNKNPGPGYYGYASEFGIYQSSHVKENN